MARDYVVAAVLIVTLSLVFYLWCVVPLVLLTCPEVVTRDLFEIAPGQQLPDGGSRECGGVFGNNMRGDVLVV